MQVERPVCLNPPCPFLDHGTRYTTGAEEKIMEDKMHSTSRRSFIRSGLVAGGTGVLGAGLLANGLPAFAEEEKSHALTKGDVAILRFLAAAEIIESDLWQQYNELGGIQDSEVPGGSGSKPYRDALNKLDPDMSQYIHDNTDDEFSHFRFINEYLISKGADPVDLKGFRNLPSSKATGAQQIGRLTNLMQLTVDTSWWTRYRSSTKNPDLGDSFPQAVPGHSQKRCRSHSKCSHPGHCQHSSVPLLLYRAGRHQPLPITGAACHQSRSAAHPAQHWPNRDCALPDVARQGRKRGVSTQCSAHRPYQWPDVS